MSSLLDPATRLHRVFREFERSFARWSRSLMDSAEKPESGPKARRGILETLRAAGECPRSRVQTPARLGLLGALQDGGPQIMSELGAELSVTPRQITNLVDALESEGLIRRSAHASDRRATVVEITPRGAAVAAESVSRFRKKLLEPFQDLSEADQLELLRLMDSLVEALRRRDPQAAGAPGA